MSQVTDINQEEHCGRIQNIKVRATHGRDPFSCCRQEEQEFTARDEVEFRLVVGAEGLEARNVHQASPEGTTWGLYLQGPGRCPRLNSGFRDGETDRTDSEGQIRDSDADDEAIAIELSVTVELSDVVNAREDAPKEQCEEVATTGSLLIDTSDSFQWCCSFRPCLSRFSTGK